MAIPRFPSFVWSGREFQVSGQPHWTDVRFAGNLAVRRVEHAERELVSWSIPLSRYSEAERQSVKTFLETNSHSTKFLFKDLKDYARTAIVLSPITSGGSVTRWKIPDAGLRGGDFPDDGGGTYVVRVAGTPVTVSQVKTDDREFVLSSGVSDAAVVDADYRYFRLCLLAQPISVRHLASLAWWDSVLSIDEVGREA